MTIFAKISLKMKVFTKIYLKNQNFQENKNLLEREISPIFAKICRFSTNFCFSRKWKKHLSKCQRRRRPAFLATFFCDLDGRKSAARQRMAYIGQQVSALLGLYTYLHAQVGIVMYLHNKFSMLGEICIAIKFLAFSKGHCLFCLRSFFQDLFLC